MPKLSIVTICYNEPNIEKTCESIVNQTWQDFEWIVVDGGSTDGTLEKLEKYKSRITTLISEPDEGIYNAINKGLKIAKGEWINCMNGGDCFSSNTVLNTVFGKKQYNVDFLYGDCNFVNDEGFKNKTFPSKLKNVYFVRDCICHQASFIKNELFKQYGLYNEQYKISSDLEQWLLFISKKCKSKHLNITVANYDLNGISSKNINLREKERVDILRKYLPENLYIDVPELKTKIFGVIPCGKIKKRMDEKKYRLSILGIPVLTVIKRW